MRRNAYERLPAPVLHLLLALFLFALQLPAAGQAPAWQSARAVATATASATSNHSEVTATAVDAAGNVYLAGNFSNTVVLGTTTLTSLGQYDIFVAKFNPASNQFVWAQRAGGTRYEIATALAVNGNSVYVAGYFESYAAGFGSATLTNTGTYNVFVAKLADAGSTGSFVWAQRAGGAGADAAYALAVSGTNVYVAGNFTSSPAGFGSVALTSVGSNDLFVAKLTDAGSTGSFVWAQRAGSSDYDGASALAASGTSVYVAGFFAGSTADFGPAALTNAGGSRPDYDGFVAKLTDAGSTGSFAWAQRAGGAGPDQASALAVSGASVYVAGNFGGPTAGFGTTVLTNRGLADAFVAKLTDGGSTSSFTWAQKAGGTGEDYAYALAISGSNVYVTGIFASATADFGSSVLLNTSVNIADVFVAKLNDAGSAGSFAWAQKAGGTNDDLAATLSLSGNSLYVAGSFNSPGATFGTITLPNSAPSPSLGFLASLADPTLTASTASHSLALAPASLYPNPAHHTATLRLPAGTASAPLTLTDAQGRTVRRYPAPAGLEAVLDLQGLPAGLYLLHGAGPAQRLPVE